RTATTSSKTQKATMYDLTPATRVVSALLPTVGDGHLDAPTPCTQMRVADMLNHLLGLGIAFTDAARKSVPARAAERTRRHVRPGHRRAERRPAARPGAGPQRPEPGVAHRRGLTTTPGRSGGAGHGCTSPATAPGPRRRRRSGPPHRPWWTHRARSAPPSAPAA